jgi:hypothetical protein
MLTYLINLFSKLVLVFLKHKLVLVIKRFFLSLLNLCSNFLFSAIYKDNLKQTQYC